MPSSQVLIPVATGLLAGGFALLGVFVSNWTAARRERATFRTETALELPHMERLVWGDDWVELSAHLQRQEARLAVAGVPHDLVEAFREISKACWRDQRESLERSDGEQGMSLALVHPREHVHRAINAYLLRQDGRRSRERLRRNAVEPVEQAIAGERRSVI